MPLVRAITRRALSAGAFVCGFAATVAADEPIQKNAAPKRRSSQITISKETTFIEGPLDEEGYVDYVAALNARLSDGVTPENNAAVLLLRATGPTEIDEQDRADFFAALGIDPLPEKGEYLVGFGEFVRDRLQIQPAPPSKAEGTRRPGKAAVESESTTPTNDGAEHLSAEEQEWQNREMDFSYAASRPWSEEEYPLCAQWLAAHAKPLQFVVEGTLRPRYYIRQKDSLGGSLVQVQQGRFISRALSLRAMHAARRGDLESAWAGLLAIHRLARLVNQGPFVIEALVGVAIEGMACSGQQAIFTHPALTARQALAFRAELEQLPPLQGMAEKFEYGERFQHLTTIASLQRKRQSFAQLFEPLSAEDLRFLEQYGFARPSLLERLRGPLLDMTAGLIDWNSVLRDANSWFDRHVAAMQEQELSKASGELEQLGAELRASDAKFGRPSALLRDAFASPRDAITQQASAALLNVPFSTASVFRRAEARAAVEKHLAEIGYALAAYRRERRKYPAALADLVPKYIAKIQLDPFSGETLKYHRTDDGYLLYSVGENGEDDAGRSFDDENRGDDIVIRVPWPPLRL